MLKHMSGSISLCYRLVQAKGEKVVGIRFTPNKAKPTNVTRPQRGARKGRTGSTPGV